MEFWTHLGIEKTKDVDAINAAYHKKLPLVNPEDKPEEFKALRSEYEEALQYAKREEETPAGELTPVEEWTDRLGKLYMSIADRCDIGKWKELLSDPLFESLDSRADAQEAMLVYLMDHWHLPPAVWRLLDETFDLRARRDELVEKFPKDFIDNAVIGGITSDAAVPYELFLPQNAGDIDPFFPLYFKAREEILNNDLDNAQATLDDLDATGILHPYGELLHIRYDFMRAEGTAAPDDVLERAKALYEQYPGNTEFSGFYADMLSTRGDTAAAIEIYDRILEAEPDNNNMRYHKATTLMEAGDYVAAKELLNKLYDAIPFNMTVRNALRQANEKAMEQYAEALKENPGDFETRYEYAWCLFQNDEEPKAMEVMDIPAPEDIAQRCDYENILTKLCQSTGDYEGCLRHAAVWREFTEKLPEGETEKEKRRKNKASDIALMECIALYDMKRYDEALKKDDEAIAAAPDEYRAYHERYLVCVALHDYDEAVRTCEKMVAIKPVAISHHLLGRAHYYRGDMQEAFNSFGQALEMDKDASSYIYRARILIMYDEYDDAKEILEMLGENNINTEGMKYCDSLILMEKEDKEDEAKVLWQEILDADGKGECDCEFLWEVCNDMAVWMIRHEADPDEILAVIDRGLKYRGDYAPLLMNKGYVLDELQEKHGEGLACYREVYERYPHHSTVCGKMGGIYYYDLRDIPAALSFFTEQEKRSDGTYCQTMLGNCYSAMEKYDESETHFKAALELDPDSERVRRDYISMLMRCRRYEDALAQAQKLAETVGDRSAYAKRTLAQVLARLGRYAEAAAVYVELYEKYHEKFDNICDIESATDMFLIGGMADSFLTLLKQYKMKLGDTFFIQMADYYKATGNDSKWLQMCRCIGTSNSTRWQMLADYYDEHRNDKKALEAIEKYYSDNPDSIMLRHIPIDCRRRQGITEGLDALFDEGVQSLQHDNTPDYQPLYLTKLAYLLIAMGRYDEAKQCVDKAFASPLCNHCRFMGCVDGYDALGEYFEAIGDYNHAALACLEGQKLAPFDGDLAVRLRRLRKEHKKQLDKELQK
ncbi:MAG: tetratricopeptide repeat protein [Clostridia bacterium]|nr:tetratricopeptide repeat protein [Clostridia bacterium]